MNEMKQQIENGLAEVFKYSGNSEEYLCGHSAGGHLASTVIHSEKLKGKMSNVHGIFLVSGLYDLRPILEVWPNYNLKMEFNEAVQSSPILKNETSLNDLEKKNVQILAVYGENDTESFRNQTINYANVIRQ